MNLYRCKECNNNNREEDLVITVNQYGEWVLHCDKCNSTQLELAEELTNQSPHSLKTYYELEEDI